MGPYLAILVNVLSIVASTIFGTLTYSLRDFSRPKLAEALAKRGKQEWLERTVDHASELAFLTATIRLICNILILMATLDLLRDHVPHRWAEYLIGGVLTAVVTTVASITIPHVLAQYAGEPFIAVFVRLLHPLRPMFRPLTKLLHMAEHVARRATATDLTPHEQADQDIQSEILAVVEEGEKTGVVDEAEREMIESVIQFRDTSVGQVMTTRPDIIGMSADLTLEKIRGIIEESGHSRIPVYEGSLDHIIGILYARDLLRYVGESTAQFDIRTAMRPPFFVPETKPLRDLLQDFRLQKVHIAIVLDEYGGTAGLVSIEDVLEELVGEISDEHEPVEPAVFKRIDDITAEVDAKIHLDELNRLLGTQLPDDAGYDTLGGFVSTHLGRIPQSGTQFEFGNASFIVLDAEPQRVNRVKVHLLPPPAVVTTG